MDSRSLGSSLVNISVRERSEKCHEYAVICLLNEENVTLIPWQHILCSNAMRIFHSWCERDGMIFDAILNETMPAAEYQSRYAAVEKQRYNKDSVAPLKDWLRSYPSTSLTNPPGTIAITQPVRFLAIMCLRPLVMKQIKTKVAHASCGRKKIKND